LPIRDVLEKSDRPFKVDESGYAEILKPVRDGDFEKQLHERLELAEREKLSAVELAKAKFSSDLQKTAAAKEEEIQELKAKLQGIELEKKLALTEAVSVIQKERDELKNELSRLSLKNSFLKSLSRTSTKRRSRIVMTRSSD
jgi:hypothetical protein